MTAVFRRGYAIGERLIRPAVVVVTGPEHEPVPAVDEPGNVGEQTDSPPEPRDT